jgi:hypothetical protein
MVETEGATEALVAGRQVLSRLVDLALLTEGALDELDELSCPFFDFFSLRSPTFMSVGSVHERSAANMIGEA